jgi:hypothetical protein
MQKLPLEIEKVLDQAAAIYTESPATTNAGRILRFIVRIIPKSLIIKAFASKLK